MRRAGWILTVVLSTLVVLVAATYWRFDARTYFPQQRAMYLARELPLHLHIGGGMVALLLAPWQLRSGRRVHGTARRSGVHRVLGRLYLLGVLAGGIGGLAMATTAYGGAVSTLGFTGLALAWLGTGAAGLLAIRQGRVEDHRRWMVRSVALTLAAVTLRLYLGLYAGLHAAGVLPVTFAQAYAAIAWLAWVPNLAIAWRITRPAGPTRPTRTGRGRGAPATVTP